MATIINKTIEGISWSFKSQFITQIIQFIVGLLLMRWIAPEDFGKFAMVLIIVSFLQIFRDAGLTVALIQKKNLSEIILSTAFWFQILIGLILSIIIYFSGNFINRIYQETTLDEISFWLSIDFFIGSFGLVPMALLRKELEFKIIFKIQFLAIICSSFCGLYMALMGMGYLSLIGKVVVFTSMSSLGAFLCVKWKPKFRFSNTALKSSLRVGLSDTGNHLLSYIVRNVDDFFIGRLIGSTYLGFYNRAYTIMLLPMINITSVFQNVLFSTWSKMQDDIEGIKSMYIKVSGIIAFITFPLMILLVILAEPIISIMFGEQWLPMTNTLKILSVIGMIQSVSSLVGVIFIVFNKNYLMLKINFITSILTIIIIILSVYIFRSIEMTALIYGVTSLILLYPVFYFASKIMNTTIKKLISPITFPFIFSLITGIVGWLIFYNIPFESILWKLFLTLISSAIFYLTISIIFQVSPINDFQKAFKYYFK